MIPDPPTGTSAVVVAGATAVVTGAGLATAGVSEPFFAERPNGDNGTVFFSTLAGGVVAAGFGSVIFGSTFGVGSAIFGASTGFGVAGFRCVTGAAGGPGILANSMRTISAARGAEACVAA